MAPNEELFPSIGTAAEQIDNLQDVDANEVTNNEEDRPTQEIESLCMKCGEQVWMLSKSCNF